jgi:hypothetical protein
LPWTNTLAYYENFVNSGFKSFIASVPDVEGEEEDGEGEEEVLDGEDGQNQLQFDPHFVPVLVDAVAVADPDADADAVT